MIICSTNLGTLTEEEILELVKEDWGWDIEGKSTYDIVCEYEEATLDMERECLDQFVNQVDKELKGHYFLIEADLGLWDGRRKARKIANSFDNAINSCLSSLEHYSVTYEKGEVLVEGSHHDGSNSFTIKPLSKRGMEYYDRHEYDPKMTDAELYEKLSHKDYTKKLKLKEEF